MRSRFILVVISLALGAALGAFVESRLMPHRGPVGCGLKAELQRISFPPVFNPNVVKLDYVVSNTSGQNYSLPDSFQVLRKSRDGILHDDAGGLGFPAEKFFPRGHRVQFSLWVPVGNLLDHAATDKDSAFLEQQLEKTQSYVLFDERLSCETELPVHR
jgi:hypothetical protein